MGRHRAQEVAPLVFGLPHRTRTAATLIPDMRQRALLADPCFILEPHGDTLAGVFYPLFFDKKGASWTHAFIACGSLLRCCGRGVSTDRFIRCKRSYTPDNS